ncbi:MAG: hypothetical protein AAGJ94_00710 [Pseudomonadota bacterium]
MDHYTATEPGAPAIMTVEASRLARLLHIPRSVLDFLEAQLDGVNALTVPGGKAYRYRDAALLAGVSAALYEDGEPFAAIDALLRSPERIVLLERGTADLERHGLVAPSAEASPMASPSAGSAAFPDQGTTAEPSHPPAPVPADAIVHRRDGRKVVDAPPPVQDFDAVLGDLKACIDILAQARR